MRKQSVRPLVLLGSLVLVLACGGGGLFDTVAFLWQVGVPTHEELIDGVLGSDQVRVNYGGVDYTSVVPQNSTVTTGAPIAFLPQGTRVMTNAWLPNGAVPVIRVVNANTGLGGITGIGLTQQGNDLVLSSSLALPLGRWKLGFEGGYQFLSQNSSEALTIGKIQYEFDVFGPNGFSNIPIALGGALPKNGASQTGLSITGRIPPNGGQGPATLTLQGSGGLNLSYTTNKAPGAETWTWTSTDTIAVPSDGLLSLDVKVNF